MKLTIQFKDPDGVYDAVHESARDSVSTVDGITTQEAQILSQKREDDFNEFLGQWIKYGEYLTVEFDTDTNTATVLKK